MHRNPQPMKKLSTVEKMWLAIGDTAALHPIAAAELVNRIKLSYCATCADDPSRGCDCCQLAMVVVSGLSRAVPRL